MPSVSKQHNLMALVANDPKAAKRLGIKQSVGAEFIKADKGKKFNNGDLVKVDADKNPGLSKLPTDVQERITKWSQSPAGTYILSLPPEQREAGLDNLDRRRGDQETRDLRKDIRIALGMAADKFLGRVQQGAQGLAQGFKQGFQGGVPPTNQ